MIVLADTIKNSELIVYSYGFEDVSKNAHWGYGYREEYILHYVIKGEGFFNGVKVKSGQGFFIEPKKLHEYHSSEENPWNYFWVIFNGNVDFIKEHFINADKNGIFDFNISSDFVNLKEQIVSNNTKISYTKALGYFYSLLSFHLAKDIGYSNEYVWQAREFIRVNLYRNVSVKEIADYVGVNDRYLYNLFIKHLNISPKDYISNMKIEKAKRLLKNTNYSITDVAVSCGFLDVLSFSRFFAKKVGVSPSIYRKSGT